MEIRSYVISHIDEAVENGYSEIDYQPVVRTLTGKLAGMEALARWRDPVYGFLRPDQFIPVLEEERLIDKLEDLDDVQAVHSNADIAEDILEKLAEQED